MAGTTHASGPAWAAVVLMILGFTLCTGGFMWHNNLPLWIVGGVVGAVGVVLARIYRIMGGAPAGDHADSADVAGP